MKKLLMLVMISLSIGMMLLTSGCGTTSSTTDSDSDSDPSESASQKLSYNTETNTWTVTESGVTVNFVGDRQCRSCHRDIHDEFTASGNFDSTVASMNHHAHNNLNGATRITGGAHSNSYHTVASSSSYCYNCHNTGVGEGGFTVSDTTTSRNTEFHGVQCEACHGPGSAHQGLHASGNITVANESGRNYINRVPLASETCLRCHVGRYNYLERDDILAGVPADMTDVDLADKSAASSYSADPGPGGMGHQGLVINGYQGYEYDGEVYTNSGHTTSGIANACVVCHLQGSGASDDTGSFLHSQAMNAADMDVCASCHSDGEARKESAQETIQDLLIELAGANNDSGTPWDDSGYGGLLAAYALANEFSPTDSYTDSDSGDVTGPSWFTPVVDQNIATWNEVIEYKRAAFNFRYVAEDRSLGVHNYAYMLKLLQDSIEAMSNP